MTVRPNHSIDGFIPRRPGAPINRHRDIDKSGEARTNLESLSSDHREANGNGQLKYSLEHGLVRDDINESLRSVDDEPKEKVKKKRKKLALRRPLGFRRLLRFVAVFGLVLMVAGGGWIGWRALLAGGSIFKGNALGLMQAAPLKEDAHGRTSVLLLGTSEDEPGHDGAYLTDSMMILTVNQKEGAAAMFSIPRDLYVKYDRICNTGSEGKINEYFNCANPDWSSEAAEEERIDRTRAFVGSIFGLDIQYGVHVNNTVLKDAVDAVGGIEVDIQGSGGAPGVLDRNFDWRCNYQCHYVKYDNGVHHLDGEHALFLAMARGSVAPTYGLGNSNFDREQNQQKIILALRDKAVSTGTLTNVSQVSSLIDALGDNLRTNFATSEIRTLMKLGMDIKPGNIQRINLRDDEEAIFVGANYGGMSVVVPASGVFQYDALRAYLAKHLSADPVVREGAKIVVLNGSGVPGAAQEEADKLTGRGLTVSGVGNAPIGSYTGNQVYQITTEGMAATRAKLSSIYRLSTETPPSFGVEADFVVVVGVAGSSE